MLKDDHGGVKPSGEKSAKTHIAVGSGSRPTASKVGIETSAPPDAHKLDRAPSSYLE